MLGERYECEWPIKIRLALFEHPIDRTSNKSKNHQS